MPISIKMSENYPGLCSDVILDSPCYETDSTGKIIRASYIGITKMEFFIAHPKITKKGDDSELSGFELDSCVPLSLAHLSLIDERSCRIAVCTELGNLYYFEICSYTGGYNCEWSAWRSYIADHDDLPHFGYKPWKIYERESDNTKENKNVMILKRPATYCLVDSVGTQSSSPKGKDDIQLLVESNQNCSAILKNIAITENSNIISHNVTEVELFHDALLSKYKISVVNNSLKTNSSDVTQNPIETESKVDKGVDSESEQPWFRLPQELSENETVINDDISELFTSLRPGKVPRAVTGVLSDVSLLKRENNEHVKRGHGIRASKSDHSCQAIKNSKEAHEYCQKKIVCILLESTGDSSLAMQKFSCLRFKLNISEDLLKQSMKIWQARSKRQLNKAPLSFQPVESLSLDDIHPIIDILDDSGHAKTYPRTRHRRRHVSKRGLSTRVLGVFKTRSARRLNPQLEDFPTNQIANELTLMASDVLLVVTEEDLMAYQCGTHLNDLYRLKGLTNYSENVVRFVVNEVLSGENPKDQARIIRYCLKVGEHCQNLQNLLTLACILKSLYSVAVSRLTETWNVFRQEYIDAYRKFKEMTQIFSPQNHFKDYAEVYAVICESDLPYLPWFDHFLWHSYYVFSKNVATDVDKTQTLTKQYLADTRSLKRGKMSTFSRLICCISDADSEVDLKMPLSSVTKMENIESNSKKNNKSFSKKVTCCVNRIPSEVILSVNSSETVTASSEIKLFVSPDKHISEINIAAILSDDEISSLNMNSEGCKKVQNSSRKRFSKSESNIDYRCKKENNQSLNSVQWSEFQDVALDDSDEEVDNICLQSVNGNNAQTRELDTSKVRLNTRRLEEKEVDKNQVVTKAYDNPPQDVTPKQDAPSSNTSHRFKIMRKPIIRLEEKSPEVPVNEITKNTVSLVTSKSSPTMTGRNINDKKERPRKPCSTELSSLAHLEGDNAQEGTQGAGEENPEILELKPEVMTPSSVKCNVCCREMCMYGATAIGELLQMQLAALKYAMKSNTTARAYITRPIPNSYQLLQMSLRQKPPPKNDFKKKSRSEK